MIGHTPLPWRVEEGTDLIWGACNPDDLSTRGMGYPIAQGRSSIWKPLVPRNDEREANAAFIVEAVNNHDRLTERVEKLERALQFIADGYDNHDVNHVDYRVKVYQVATEALTS